MIKDAARPAEAASGPLTRIISSLDPRRSWAKVRPLACRPHRLSFPQHPPEGAREHPSKSCPPQPTTQKGTHVPGEKLKSSTNRGPLGPAQPTLPPSALLSSLPSRRSLHSSHMCLFSVLPSRQAQSCPRAFAQPCPLDWFHLFPQVSVQMSLLPPSFPLTLSYFLVLPAPRLLIFLLCCLTLPHGQGARNELEQCPARDRHTRSAPFLNTYMSPSCAHFLDGEAEAQRLACWA